MSFPQRIMRFFDRGHGPNLPRPASRRALLFERMEERLTLSTSRPVFSFESITPLEGGLITLNAGQGYYDVSRGVIDNEGLSLPDNAVTNGTGLVLNNQNFQKTEVDASEQKGANLLSGTSRNESVLGGGLQQVIPIAPLELNPSNQPDGGHIQIARLFDPSFEQLPGRESQEILATNPTEPLRGETKAAIHDYAPAQGREMAFEVASTSPLASRSAGHVSQFDELGMLGESDAERASDPAKSTNANESHGAANVPTERNATQPTHRADIPSRQIPAEKLAATVRVDHEKSSNITQEDHEAARDVVFAEWEEEKWRQGPSAIEAPLATDRQQQMDSTIVLSGAALLFAGIHFARAHSRDALKEFEQLEGGSKGRTSAKHCK
ncbi:hypothetical protein [Bythopirellula polymerisocia]|uniref:Uncharacterized protein n=1 Tax=Bythopirellula polymerisocia TaxID=2528003 RepID=A0A5C6D2U4_9BACT|nr:hypothetical protein [Bythopirellula polymerisocia]TWU29977.1 hypothetical protein Pla144_07580 [Bythopirellula polymerisocia]